MNTKIMLMSCTRRIICPIISLIVISMQFCLAGDDIFPRKDYLVMPDNFNLIVEYGEKDKTTYFNLKDDNLIKIYKEEIIFRGEKITEKVLVLKLTSEEKKILYEYIFRNKLLLITQGNGQLNASDKITSKGNLTRDIDAFSAYYNFSISTFTALPWTCSVVQLDEYIPQKEEINKLWGLVKIIELILNQRKESFYYDYWILCNLKERVKMIEAGGKMEYPEDRLPAPFTDILKNPDVLIKVIDTWEKNPIIYNEISHPEK